MEVKLNPEIKKFILALEKSTMAKTLHTIELLEKFGNQLSLPHSKKISRDLYELRVRGQQEVRIFYCFKNNSTILLSGFIKKSRKTPLRELQRAKDKLSSLTQYNL